MNGATPRERTDNVTTRRRTDGWWNTVSTPQPQIDSPVVSVRGLAKTFGGRTVLRDVSLELASGEVYGLLGPNGAGKTTTLRAILGLVAPDAGTVRVFGSDPREESLVDFGVMFEYETLKPSWSVRDNLLTTCHAYELPPSRIETCLDRVRLDSAVADTTFDALSKGMKRKASLADALVPDPDVLVLDEPASGLDPESREAILQLLEQADQTILFSSHALSDVQRVCDRVGIVRDGRTIVEASVGDSLWLARGSYPELTACHAAGEVYLPDRATVEAQDLDAERVDLETAYFAVREADG